MEKERANEMEVAKETHEKRKEKEESASRLNDVKFIY